MPSVTRHIAIYWPGMHVSTYLVVILHPCEGDEPPVFGDDGVGQTYPRAPGSTGRGVGPSCRATAALKKHLKGSRLLSRAPAASVCGGSTPLLTLSGNKHH